MSRPLDSLEETEPLRPGACVPSVERRLSDRKATALATCDLLRPLGDMLVISWGHSALLTDLNGQLKRKDGGFFHHQSRFLARADLRIAGRAVDGEAAATPASDRMTSRFPVKLPQSSLAPSRLSGAAGLPPPTLEVHVDWRIRDVLLLRYRITNRTAQRVTASLSLRLTTDFAEQDELTSGRRRPAIAVARRRLDPTTLLLQSLHPKLRHATRIRFRGLPALRFVGDRVLCNLELGPQAQCVAQIEVTPLFDPGHAAQLPDRSQGADAQEWQAGCSRLLAGNATVQAAWDTAAQDLESLQLGDGAGEERFTPAAGIPHYLALFGRDALMTGWQASLLNPAMLRGALGLVGRWTAEAVEPQLDAQPGRVLHQRELGPMALLGKTPFLRYYGDHSASPLWLIGLADAYARRGDAAWFLGFRDLARRILDWMDRFGDLDGDGLYEYRSTAGPHGLKNQGWKDSNEAILYPDGQIAPDPLVVCEVQALFAAARQAMAAAFGAAGDPRLAADLDRQAARDRQRLRDTMWMEDEGFLALGLDADKRQIRTLASNAGESLAYGSLDEPRARRVADRLMQPDFFTGWGVRTLSSDHPAYNPLGYHLGSVWPCFTALTARGFARYGFIDHFHALAGALFDATELFERRRLPEVFGGHPRENADPRPGLYPDACWPQAWSSGAIMLLVDTLAGLKAAAPLGAAVVAPKLPPWLPELTLSNVRLGRGRLDLRVRRREDGEMVCEVLDNSSGLRLLGPGLDEPSEAERSALGTYVDSLP